MNSLPVVETYLDALYQHILRLGAASAFARKARDNVGMQVYSFLAHWNDVAFRNTLLVIGKEEGESYTPPFPINPFVVVTVRNSLLENLHSVNHLQAGLRKEIGPVEIKRLTQQAIRHFSGVDFDALGSMVSLSADEDCYGHLPEKYPLAWEVLRRLGNCRETVITYPPVHASIDAACFDFGQTNEKQNIDQSRSRVVLDGYSSTIDDTLKQHLVAIHNGELDCLFVDSFKMLTRNIEKLMLVLNYILAGEAVFFTSNYYITNGYIEQRPICLPPTHSSANPFDKARQRQLLSGGIGRKHEQALRSIFG